MSPFSAKLKKNVPAVQKLTENQLLSLFLGRRQKKCPSNVPAIFCDIFGCPSNVPAMSQRNKISHLPMARRWCPSDVPKSDTLTGTFFPHPIGGKCPKCPGRECLGPRENSPLALADGWRSDCAGPGSAPRRPAGVRRRPEIQERGQSTQIICRIGAISFVTRNYTEKFCGICSIFVSAIGRRRARPRLRRGNLQKKSVEYQFRPVHGRKARRRRCAATTVGTRP
jgi:hypothetical protein